MDNIKYYILACSLLLTFFGLGLLFSDKFERYVSGHLWKNDSWYQGKINSNKRYIRGVGTLVIGLMVLLWLITNHG